MANTKAELTDELQRERGRREAAEANSRAILAAMRDLAASADAEVASRVEEQLTTGPAPLTDEAIERAFLLGEEKQKLESRLRTMTTDAALYRIAAGAGVRPGRVEHIVRQYRDAIDSLEDGTPIVAATASTDVLRYLATVAYAELPEFFDVAEHRRVQAQLGIVGHIGGAAA